MSYIFKKKPFLGLSFLVVLLVFAGAALKVSAARVDLIRKAAERQHQDPTLVLTLGKAEIFDLTGDVSDILIADPGIVDVQALQVGRLYLVGRAIGDTNMIAIDANGEIIERVNVHVRVDEVRLQQVIASLFPKEEVEVETAAENLILKGMVSTPSVAARIRELAERFAGETGEIINMMDVLSEEQVMLRVRIMEISRSLVRELGVKSELPNFTDPVPGIQGTLGEVVSNRATLGNRPAIGNTNSVFEQLTKRVQGSFLLPGGGVTEDPYGTLSLFHDDIAPFLFTLQALDQDNLVRTLAEPNLTAMSGEEAGFLAGGEFPVPTGRDNNGLIEITFQSFGVSLNFRPVVMSEDRISLTLETEVSTVSRQNSVTLGGVEVPGRDVRRANTNVELPSGGSLMIAGLIDTRTLNGLEALPGIKDIPVIGDLMKSKNFRRQESELVIVITAILVKPFADKDENREVPLDRPNPMAEAFASNMRRVYGGEKLASVLDEDNNFGYLLD